MDKKMMAHLTISRMREIPDDKTGLQVKPVSVDVDCNCPDCKFEAKNKCTAEVIEINKDKVCETFMPRKQGPNAKTNMSSDQGSDK